MKKIIHAYSPDPKTLLSIIPFAVCVCFALVLCVFFAEPTSTDQKQTITDTATGASTVQTKTLATGDETPFTVADTDTIQITRQQEGYSTLTIIKDKTAGATYTLTTTPTKYLNKGEPVSVGTKVNRTSTIEITSKSDGTIIIVDILGSKTYTLEKSYKKEISIYS